MSIETSATESSSEPFRLHSHSYDVERRDDIPVLSCENGVWNGQEPKPKRSNYISRSRFINFKKPVKCREATILTVGILLTCIALGLIVAGALRLHECQRMSIVRLKHPVGQHTMDHIGDEFFTFNQLVMLNNFAFQKAASQTSEDDLTNKYTTEVDGAATLAVDGSPYTCARTDAERDPSWQVDLAEIQPIGSFRILSSNASTLHDFGVYLGYGLNDKKLCFHHKGPVRSIDTRITCNEEMSGRFVTIVLRVNGEDRLEHLVLCEVMVFGR